MKLFEENLATHLTKADPHDNDIVVCYVNIGKTFFLWRNLKKPGFRQKRDTISERSNFVRGKIEALTLIINCMEKQGKEALVEWVELEELKKSHGIAAQVH